MKNWIHSENDKENIVLSSRVRLARNIKELPFPGKLNFIEARENGKLIYNTLKDNMPDDEIELHEMWNGSEDLYKKYVEKYLVSKELIKNSNKAAFILNRNQTISIMINEDDHIRLQCITAGLNLQEAFESATEIDDKLEKGVDYAFDEQLGYLTTYPNDLGTGMKASVLIHLPALTMNQEIKNIAKDFTKMGISIKGVYLDGEKVLGNLYLISNTISLGITEDDIISKVKDAALNIIAEEKKFREILLVKCRHELEDKIYRSYGLLKTAVLLDFKETIELLSNVRLGVELSMLDIDKSKLNEVLVSTNDFSIQNGIDRTLDAKEMKYERAKRVKEILF